MWCVVRIRWSGARSKRFRPDHPVVPDQLRRDEERGSPMRTTYFKRLRMEINLRRVDLPESVLPEPYEWRAWHPVLIEAHARGKWESFRSEIDAILFPSFVDIAGCRRLMRDISHRRGFLPQSTWLISRAADGFGGPHPVATIQGVNLGWWRGSIQNVGVVPEHRGF